MEEEISSFSEDLSEIELFKLLPPFARVGGCENEPLNSGELGFGEV
jgi:hypothetical protein